MDCSLPPASHATLVIQKDSENEASLAYAKLSTVTAGVQAPASGHPPVARAAPMILDLMSPCRCALRYTRTSR